MNHKTKFINTEFGDQLEFETPLDCDGVVLCIDTLMNSPINMYLPHNIYRKDLLKIIKKYPDIRGFTIIPFRHSEKIKIPLELINNSKKNEVIK